MPRNARFTIVSRREEEEEEEEEEELSSSRDDEATTTSIFAFELLLLLLLLEAAERKTVPGVDDAERPLARNELLLVLRCADGVVAMTTIYLMCFASKT